MTPTPIVSVVIPARNAADTLDAQLAALATQHPNLAWEVVVVDNLSTDTTADVVLARQASFPELRLVTCREPGSNRSRNAGVRAATAEAILFCDADDVVAPGWVAAMLHALQRDPLVGGRLECTLLNTAALQTTRDEPTRDGLPKVFWHLPYAISANMAVTRAAFESLDGFDESLSVGGDEIDFSWRAQYAGLTIGYAPDAIVHYRFKPELRDGMRQMYLYGRGNARVRARHIALGMVPVQTRRQQGSLIKGYLVELLHVERLARAGPRRRYLEASAWFAGSLVGLVRYGAII